MKAADQTLQANAIIEGDPRRPRRIALEPLAGGGPLPAMADRKYIPVMDRWFPSSRNTGRMIGRRWCESVAMPMNGCVLSACAGNRRAGRWRG